MTTRALVVIGSTVLGDAVTETLLLGDGTAAGTASETLASLSAISPAPATLLDRAFLVSGQQLDVTDGSLAGTVRVPGTPAGVTGIPAVLNGRALFTATVSGGTQLWATDGTAAGTVELSGSPTEFVGATASLALFD